MSLDTYTTTTGTRFYPVQCTHEKFQTLAAEEGHLYFVTDKKKLYLGKDKAMIPMCANSGIFYGKKEIVYENDGNKPDPNVVFTIDDLEEGSDIPEKDDLILNIGTDDLPDGCFYRVNEVIDNEIETTRLTLQGTGGGSGGTGGGTTSGSFSISIIGNKAKVYSSTATSMKVSFQGYYDGTAENRISLVKFTKSNSSEPFYTHTEELEFNQEQEIDLIAHMGEFGPTKTTVTLAIQDLYGNERSVSFTIQVVELSLKATKAELLSTTTSSYTYSCYLSGATSGVSNKKITYTFYNENNLNVPVLEQTKELSVSDEGDQQKNLDLSSLSHGIYVMKVVASASISSSNIVLESNELTHKIARFVNTTEPLLMIMTPEETQQYTNIPLNYLLVTSESNKSYTLDVKINGITKTSLNIVSNVADSYPLYFEEKGTYTLLCTVVELALSYSDYLYIKQYTGELPVIDPTRDDLMLYLNPKGKSNDATDRDEWKDYNGNYTATLSGLHYGASNGWLMDSDGTSYLKLSSGASLVLDDFLPFQYDPTKTGVDSRMGYGMTIELDFELSGVLDYDTELIRCISTTKTGTIQVGFAITGDQVRFYNNRLNDSINDKGQNVGALMSLNLVENKRIRLSFVIEPNTGSIEFPMCYSYLDGKLSAAVIYDSNDSYKDSTDYPAKLQIFASDAQVKIYGIRFYSSALTDKVILNNYTASLPTLEERQARYDTNNVFNASGDIDYVLVSAEDYNLQIPYMKITGGWATVTDDKWKLKDAATANVGLPTGKKDYRLIDVEVKYPKNAYFSGYEDYKFVNEFASGKTMAEAFGEKPSNGGAIMYAQGTSSMEYPVKNLRLRFKKDKNWYVVRPDIAPVEIICMKADYMESSGSHNTGAANLIDALYNGVGMKTPGQSHDWGDDKTIVTCIKGHPCLIFYSETGEPGTYKYIGKYNLNLDKATPEPFGFNHNDDEFGYLPEGAEYYEIQYDDDGDKFVGQLNPTSGGDYVSGQTETLKTVQAGEKVNSIHCFEFLDNAVEVCNFLPKSGYTYKQTWYDTFKNSDNELVPGWTLGFESRYPEDRVGYHDADMLYPLASWLNELHTLRKQEEEEGKVPTDITYTYEYEKATAYEEFVAYYIKNGDVYEAAYPTSSNFADDTYYTRSVADSRFAMNSLERFKREYECYLDKKFLLTYYLVTEALLMADSRVKNMMIATWGPEERSYKDYLTEKTVATNNYIFYPIFYDMDTMLGLDNTGVYRFNYYDEDTDSSIYNGDEVLWNFVRDALGNDLIPWYSSLETASLKTESMLPYFNSNQANMANEAFYNGDATYKYIDPARDGYYDYLYDKVIKPGEGPYLYAAQGDRSLMREWILTNRMRFLRGKYNSNQYQSGDRIEFRWYYPTGEEADASLNASRAAVPPDGKFTFTSLKTGYSGVKLGANGNVYNERFENEETKEISLPEASSANGTEAYLLGLSNLTDLGDLSNKYMQKFIIASDDVRLKHLTLGNPHKDYNNPYWKPGSAQSQKIGLSGCSYLETFNLQNCSAYNNTLDFSDCPAIQKILLTGSGVTGITLPVNGMLSELRLPTSVTSIKIDTHTSLTNFSLGGYDYGTGTKIGEQDENGNLLGSYQNNYSNIQKLYVVDTPIDTYEMVRQAGDLSEYYLKGIDWTITADDTQYCVRNASYFDKHPDLDYYYYDSGEYKLYEGDTYPTSTSLYERYDLLSGNKVQCIPVLEYLQTKTFMEGTKHADALSGTITINIEGASVDELEIYQKYIDVYPNVEIKYGSKMNVEGATKVNFYRIDVDSLGNGSLDGIEPYFSALTANQLYTLSDLIDTDAFTEPVKTSTTTQDFTFTGMWYDWNDNKKVYCQDKYYTGEGTLFSEVTPDRQDLPFELVPKFEATTRTYKVNFYDYDYVIGDDPIFSADCEFEDVLGNVITDPRLTYMYRPADDLTGTQRYVLKGWLQESDFIKNNTSSSVIDLSSTLVRSDLNFFACYKVEDASVVASSSAIFTTNGSAISINPSYRELAGGKITIPSKSGSTTLLTLKDFKNMPNVTEIYFLSDAEYLIVSDNAFDSNMATAIYLPDTITTIKSYAFQDALNLETVTLSDNITSIGNDAFRTSITTNDLKVHITKLPANLTSLGSRSFYHAGPNVTITELPVGITEIPTQCFMLTPNIAITEFPQRDASTCSIGTQSFWGCGKVSSATSITINSPWALDSKATGDGNNSIFYEGYPYVTDIYVYASLAGDDLDALEKRLFGALRDNVTVHVIE